MPRKKRSSTNFDNNDNHKSKHFHKEKITFIQENEETLPQEEEELLYDDDDDKGEEEEILSQEEEILSQEEEEVEKEIQEIHNNDENKADNLALNTLDDDSNKKGSMVWQHFDKFEDDKGIWAKCRHCR